MSQAAHHFLRDYLHQTRGANRPGAPWAAHASLQSADRVIDRITERFWLLGEHPRAGKRVPGIVPGLYCFPAGNYLIYYRSTRRGTDVLHIFHGAREQSRAFKATTKLLPPRK